MSASSGMISSSIPFTVSKSTLFKSKKLLKRIEKRMNKFSRIDSSRVSIYLKFCLLHQIVVKILKFYIVDAAIVRIMKAKKELSHGELMATLFEHLNFPMSPPDLKKRIEHLIDRDFIERDPECANRYRYLA